MIYGRLIDRKAIVPVIFRLPQQPDFSLSFVVDTGFNGYLTLPAQAVSAMNLPLDISEKCEYPFMTGFHSAIANCKYQPLSTPKSGFETVSVDNKAKISTYVR